MNIALAILCVGGVAFLLRFLVALVNELGGTRLASRREGLNFRYRPPKHRAKVVVMNSKARESKSTAATG